MKALGHSRGPIVRTGVVYQGWDYEHYPSDQIRADRCQAILVDLDAGRLTAAEHAKDSRPIHLRMFEGMTPIGHEYFAGHYRGESIGLLLNYNVQVPGDARVGTPAADVSMEMQRFEQLVDAAASGQTPIADARSLIILVAKACALLVEFLRIHPYANGNGHIGRFIVWAILVSGGVRPRTWPLNDKLPYPYGELLTMYRNGQREPLIHFVLSHI